MKHLAFLTLVLAALATPAWCADQIKATIGQRGLDTLMPEAVSLKFIPEPLTQAQLAELIQLQGKK